MKKTKQTTVIEKAIVKAEVNIDNRHLIIVIMATCPVKDDVDIM